jgi:hypothetical protein
MRDDIISLPVKNQTDLASFDKHMTNLTLGFSLKRCMAYSDFRMAVLRSHQTKQFTNSKFFLVHNHYISVEKGVATLYRHIQDDDVGSLTCDDKDYNKDDNKDEEVGEDLSRKRVKCGHV